MARLVILRAKSNLFLILVFFESLLLDPHLTTCHLNVGVWITAMLNLDTSTLNAIERKIAVILNL